MAHGTREALLDDLARLVAERAGTHRLRIAIDGPPASGKTRLAEDLAEVLERRGHPVLRAGIDAFLHPRRRRYARGVFSGEGCYHDAHDLETLNRVLLRPLGPGGDGRVQLAAFDRAADRELVPEPVIAPPAAVLVFDGVFLLRPELIGGWDLTVFVRTPFDTTLARALVREREADDDGDGDVRRRWRDRYLPAQQLYADLVEPVGNADVLVDNDDLRRPTWRIRSRVGQSGDAVGRAGSTS